MIKRYAKHSLLFPCLNLAFFESLFPQIEILSTCEIFITKCYPFCICRMTEMKMKSEH